MSSEVMAAERIPEAIVEQIRSGALDSLSPEKLLAWGMDAFAPRLSLSASFGSPEGMAILDMVSKIDRSRTRVFTIDTGRLPQETYNLIDRVRDRYDVEVEVFFPDSTRVEKMVREHGQNLFYESVEKRQLCCNIRKVLPLDRAMEGLDAWIAGLRAEHSKARSDVRLVEIDAVHGGVVKLNPLARWTGDEVAEYVRKNAVPVNALHKKGYPSVGCAPCTRALRPGESDRDGRWWWEQDSNKECGIHVGYHTDGSGI